MLKCGEMPGFWLSQTGNLSCRLLLTLGKKELLLVDKHKRGLGRFLRESEDVVYPEVGQEP